MKLFFAFIFIFSLNRNLLAVEPGTVAPDFSVEGHDGKIWKLADLKGKIVVLEWYNDGCPFVRKHYDPKNMQNLQEKYKKDVVWLTVSTSKKEKQGHLADGIAASKKYQEEKMHSAAILLDGSDGKVGKTYEAVTTPHMYVISSEGVVVYNGAIDSIASADAADLAKSINYVDEALGAIKAGKKIAVTKTKPYGCSVKY